MKHCSVTTFCGGFILVTVSLLNMDWGQIYIHVISAVKSGQAGSTTIFPHICVKYAIISTLAILNNCSKMGWGCELKEDSSRAILRLANVM